jgi:uncharacterized protein YbjT (DUF2867 family)
MANIAVAGAHGMVGTAVVAELQSRHNEVVTISRRDGVDVLDPSSLVPALEGVDTVVDVLNTLDLDAEASADFFKKTSSALVAGEAEAGVRHHVALSIVNSDRILTVGHYAGKRAQESAVRQGVVPWTIVRSTQFFDFPSQVVSWTTQDGTCILAPVLMQPIDVRDVAEALVDAALAEPTNGIGEIAGPETHDAVDMARRSLVARGDSTRLLAGWHDGPFGTELVGDALLPSSDVRVMPRTFDAWLAEQHPAA